MNIPASLMKQLPGMTTYLPMEKSSICQIGKKVSSTVTSHYYKGLSNHLDNLVIVITENREQRTENREQRTENREQRIIAILFIMATTMVYMMVMMEVYFVYMESVKQLQLL